MNIVTGVFTEMQHAKECVREIRDAGITADDIGLVTRNREVGTRMASEMGVDYTSPSGDAFTSGRHIYDRLPDGYTQAIHESNLPDDATNWYRAHLDDGRILVIVRAGDRMDDVARIVHKHHGILYGERREEREMVAPTTAGEVRIPIMDEEVLVEKREHQIGEVRVTPETRREEVDLPTTVTHEEIRVERRKLERPLSPDEYKGMKGMEGEIRMPIVEEEVHVVKRPIIREEFIVTRMPVSERQTLHETVTHTEPHVETTGDVHVEGMTDEERRRRGRPAA